MTTSRQEAPLVTSWILVFAGATVVGISFVGLLALRRIHEPLCVLAGIAGTGAASYGVVRIIGGYASSNAVLASLALSLAAFAGGYGLGSALLYLTGPQTRQHALPEPPEDCGLFGVILLACVEPQSFSTSETAREIAMMDDAGLPEATVGVTPFLYAAQKARYRAVGGTSPSLKQAQSTLEQLETRLDRSTFGRPVLVTCIGGDTLPAAVTRLASTGHRRIIVTSLSAGESHEMDSAKAAVDALRPEALGMHVVYTPPLWGSDPLAEAIARRIWTARGEPERTGVALVLHGQPQGYERTNAGFDVEENAFANRVRMLLAERGIPENLVRPCFAEWREPDVTETVRHLTALGCTRVLISPVVYPFECLVTMLDIPMAIRQARVEAHVTTVTLNAWGEDNVVVDVVAQAITRAVRELGDSE